MIKKGQAMRLGCLSCLKHPDNEIVDLYFERENGSDEEMTIKVIVKCSCGAINRYTFKYYETDILDGRGAIIKYEKEER